MGQCHLKWCTSVSASATNRTIFQSQLFLCPKKQALRVLCSEGHHLSSHIVIACRDVDEYQHVSFVSYQPRCVVVVGTATPVRTKIVPLSVQFRGDPASRILRCMITRCAWGWIRNCRHYLTSFCDLQFVQMDDGLDGDFVDYFPFSVTSRLIILVRGMLNVCVELKQESCRL